MTRPGEMEFTIKLSGQDALDFVRMAKASGKHRLGYAAFAKSILLDVIADDRAAHEGPPNHSGDLTDMVLSRETSGSTP